MEHLIKTYSGEDIDEFTKKYELNDLGFNAKYELNCGQERWATPNEKLYDAAKYKLTHLSRSEGFELNFNYD